MARKKKAVQRRGRPVTFYLRQDQAGELDVVSKQRRVAKAELIRLAVDRLLQDIRGGQMTLPLGVGEL